MQRRLLVIALVFVVGFGVGYGITWLLVGSAGRDEAPPRSAARETVERVAAQPDSAVAVLPDAAATPAETAETAEMAADAGLAPAPQADAAAAPEVAEQPAKAPWEACHMHVCRLDFGKITGGISMRKGSLEHGKPVDWDQDFAKADKIGTLEAGPNVKVEVLAIGLDGDKPSAAYIIRKTKRSEVKGVIALRIGDKQLELVPLEE